PGAWPQICSVLCVYCAFVVLCVVFCVLRAGRVWVLGSGLWNLGSGVALAVIRLPLAMPQRFSP
ncbi:MAG: hypothetical protein QMC46_05015, partial [Burkholderiaceae bacterium]